MCLSAFGFYLVFLKTQAISSGDIPNSMRCSVSSHHPAALAEQLGGTLVELGTLVEPCLRAAPDHPGAYLG